MKKIVYFILITFLFTACNSTSNYSKNASANSNKIVQIAMQNLGAPYKTAGTTRAGFDCSGLVYSTLKTLNISTQRTSFDQSKMGKLIGNDKRKAQKGDLVFFKTNNSSRINHVGIVTDFEDNELIFIHSSTSKGVILSSTKQPYYQKTFTQINRISE